MWQMADNDNDNNKYFLCVLKQFINCPESAISVTGGKNTFNNYSHFRWHADVLSDHTMHSTLDTFSKKKAFYLDMWWIPLSLHEQQIRKKILHFKKKCTFTTFESFWTTLNLWTYYKISSPCNCIWIRQIFSWGRPCVFSWWQVWHRFNTILWSGSRDRLRPLWQSWTARLQLPKQC